MVRRAFSPAERTGEGLPPPAFLPLSLPCCERRGTLVLVASAPSEVLGMKASARGQRERRPTANPVAHRRWGHPLPFPRAPSGQPPLRTACRPVQHKRRYPPSSSPHTWRRRRAVPARRRGRVEAGHRKEKKIKRARQRWGGRGAGALAPWSRALAAGRRGGRGGLVGRATQGEQHTQARACRAGAVGRVRA